MKKHLAVSILTLLFSALGWADDTRIACKIVTWRDSNTGKNSITGDRFSTNRTLWEDQLVRFGLTINKETGVPQFTWGFVDDKPLLNDTTWSHSWTPNEQGYSPGGRFNLQSRNFSFQIETAVSYRPICPSTRPAAGPACIPQSSEPSPSSVSVSFGIHVNRAIGTYSDTLKTIDDEISLIVNGNMATMTCFPDQTSHLY
jgi:hypothetical protein